MSRDVPKFMSYSNFRGAFIPKTHDPRLMAHDPKLTTKQSSASRLLPRFPIPVS